MTDPLKIEILTPVVQAAQSCCRALAPLVAGITGKVQGRSVDEPDWERLYKLHAETVETLFRCLIVWGLPPRALRTIVGDDSSSGDEWADDHGLAVRRARTRHDALLAAVDRSFAALEETDGESIRLRYLLQDYVDELCDALGSAAGSGRVVPPDGSHAGRTAAANG